MKEIDPRLLAAAIVTLSLSQNAFANEPPSLFKVVTVKDEIVIGLSANELAALGGQDAGAVARAIAAKGTLTAWQYAVRRGPDGNLQQAPLRQVGLLANASLRVEPFATPLVVVPHE